jgi:hypothetical protein
MDLRFRHALMAVVTALLVAPQCAKADEPSLGTASAANKGVSRCFRTAFAIFLALAAPLTAAPAVSVLFVGNSLTQANNLPNLFKQFAAQSRLHAAVEIRATMPGGAFFLDHWKRGDALVLLRQQPTFLILQGQSTEPVSAPQNFSYYAGLFKAEADRLGTTTVLFSTWSRPANDPYYKETSSGGSPAEMQNRLNASYAKLAQDLGAKLAPVGVAWQNAERTAPDIQLLDGTQHPSPAGSYLAAAVLFRTIFNTSDASSTFYGVLPQATALKLQQIAAEPM